MTRIRRTAAHWGSYIVADGPGGRPELHPDPLDPRPSGIGEGWVEAMLDTATRIRRPAVRRGWLDGDKGAGRCRDGYVEVGWDEALDLVSAELGRVIETRGNEAIYAGSYGWASAGRFHHAQSQMRRFLNLIGGHVSSRDTYSHGAAEVLMPYLTGMTHPEFNQQMTTWPRIAEHCELFVAIGGLSGRAMQISSGGTVSHEAGDWFDRAFARGMKLVSVSPERNVLPGAPDADWLAIRPGTDTALLLGLIHELAMLGRVDEAFLARCTTGWPDLRDYVLGRTDGVPKSAKWAAGICDLPAGRIRKLAARMAGARTMVSVSWSVQRTHHGEQPLWAALALACVLGQVGQPGGGFAYGYGSSAHIGRPVRHIPWPSLSQGQNPVSDFIPVARVADMLLNPGAEYRYNGELRRYPHARLVYWTGGNPFHHHQDLNRLEAAWSKPETVIVHDHSWTATARRADIVLPCTSPLEREDIMMNPRDPVLVYMSRVLPPVGEARSDHDIFAALSARMGVGDAFSEGRDEDAWLRRLWDEARKVAVDEGLELPEFDDFQKTGRVDLQGLWEDRDCLARFVADPEGSPLATESGKIPLFSERIAGLGLADCPGHPAWLEPVEWLGHAEPGEFHLLSGQPNSRLHAQLDAGAASQASKGNGRETCAIHPQAARKLGLEDGDLVRLWNKRGACLATLSLSDGIRPDCVALATGAWLDLQVVDGESIDVHGNPNVLTIDIGTSDLAQATIGHTTLARIAHFDGSAPALAVYHPPGGVAWETLPETEC